MVGRSALHSVEKVPVLEREAVVPTDEVHTAIIEDHRSRIGSKSKERRGGEER